MSKVLFAIVSLTILCSMPAHAAESRPAPASASANHYWLSENLTRLAIWEHRPVARTSDTSSTQEASR